MKFIAGYCQKKTGYKVSQRTIQLDIDTMRHDPFLRFYAPIEYSKKKAYFYLDNDYQLLPFRFNQADVALLEHIFSLVKDRISKAEQNDFTRIITMTKLLSTMAK